MQSYAKDQADFMDMSGQQRFTLAESLQQLCARNAKFLAEIGMHFGLIEEEVWKELRKNYMENIVAPPENMTQEEKIDHYITALTKLADDLVDSVYVLTSMSNKIGIDFDTIWYLVHQANMNKGFPCPDCNIATQPYCLRCNGVGKIVRRRPDGKTLKPDGWVAPDATIREMIVCSIERGASEAARIAKQDNL